MRYSHLILDVVYSHKYKGLDVEGWKNYFQIETSQEFTQLMKDLNLLESECFLLRDRKNRYFSLEQLDCFKGILRINPKGFGFVENEEIVTGVENKVGLVVGNVLS